MNMNLKDDAPIHSAIPLQADREGRETPTIVRYDLITNYRCGTSIEEMERCDDGEWVRFEDVEARISAAEATITRLEAEIAALRPYVQHLPYCGAHIARERFGSHDLAVCTCGLAGLTPPPETP